VPLVESERTNTIAAHDACRKYLRPLLERNVETVVLGCTHFPLLLPMLREVASEYSADVRFVDPAEAVACEVAALTSQPPLPWSGRGRAGDNDDRFFVSGDTDGVRGWIEKLLGNTAPRIEAGPVFEPPASLTEHHQFTKGIAHVAFG
jgi:glutamate racemase